MEGHLIRIISDPIKKSDLEKFCRGVLTINGIIADYEKYNSERDSLMTIEVFYKKNDLKYFVDFFGKTKAFSQEELDKYPKTLDL